MLNMQFLLHVKTITERKIKMNLITFHSLKGASYSIESNFIVTGHIFKNISNPKNVSNITIITKY